MEHWDMVYQDMTEEQFKQFSDGIDRFIGYDISYFNDGRRVLDAGCGTGRVTNELIRKGAMSEFHCVDISTRKAREFLPDTVTVKNMNLEDLRYPDNYFDYVICRGVLHHCQNPYKALKELCRVCKGEMVLVTTRRKGLSYLRVYGKRILFKLIPQSVAVKLTNNRPFLRHFIFDTAKAPYRHTLSQEKVIRIMDRCGVNGTSICCSSQEDLGHGQSMTIRAWKRGKVK